MKFICWLINNFSIKPSTFLRKIKHKFARFTHNKLYCTYIRPLLECTGKVWGGFSQSDSNRSEKAQLNAARINTGLPSYASLNSLYSEICWETLAERLKIEKLLSMYKIVNEETQSHLKSLFPRRVIESSNYNIRSNENFEIPFSRLCYFET